MHRFLVRTAWLCLPLLAASAAQAGPPAVALTKPARIVVTVPPGGGIDNIARQLSARIAPLVGQPVIVENRPGASGVLGVDNVVRAAPDGSNLVLATGSTMTVVPHLGTKLPYDTTRDLTPIAQIGVTPLIMLVRAEDAARTVKDFVAAGKARSASFSYASYGSGSVGHLIGEAFKHAAALDMVHVPYKGCAAAINDLLGGQVNAVMCDIGSAAGFLADGTRIRGLAITGEHRVKAFPAIPTFVEAGLPTLGPLVGWLGIFGPARMAPALSEGLTAAFATVLQSEGMRNALEQIGYEASTLSVPEFRKKIAEDTQVWGRLIQSIGGIKPD